jgi:hypothetical protein
MLNVVMLSINMLKVVMLSALMLNVMAPNIHFKYKSSGNPPIWQVKKVSYQRQ